MDTRPMFTIDSSAYGLDQLRRERSRNEELAAQMAAIKRASEVPEPTNEPLSELQSLQGYDFNAVEPTSAQRSVLPTKAQITQEFGRYNPTLEPSKSGRNWGVDFGVKEGTPLALPPGEWQVIQTYDKAKGRGRVGNRENTGYGNSVLVMNPKTGETMRFSHLSGVNVQPGQVVRGGTVIGASGATGNVTGAHLDLEYKVGGQFRDITKSPYAKYLFGA